MCSKMCSDTNGWEGSLKQLDIYMSSEPQTMKCGTRSIEQGGWL